MAYRLAGNDPTRDREYPTPAEVEAMITGGDGAPDYQERPTGWLAEAPGFHKTGGTPEEVADEIMVWMNGDRSLNTSRAIARHEGCCATCGRKSDCCCQGCQTCPQSRMAEGKISAAWAKRQVDLGDADPREMC